MSDYATCRCQFCDGQVEFVPESGDAESKMVVCPHCRLDTLVFYRKAAPPKLRPSRRRAFVLATIVVSFIAILPLLHWRHLIAAIKPTHYGPEFRRVGGQVLDTRDKSKWGGILQGAGYSGGGWTGYAIKADKILGSEVFCQIIRLNMYPDAYSGAIEVQSQEPVCEVVIFHYPNASSLLSGNDMPDCLCTRIENYNNDGDSIIALDCGTNPN